MSHLQSFGLDDFIELSFLMEINEHVFPNETFIENHSGINGLFFQFSPEPGIATSDFLSHDDLTFHGLVVMLIQHNSHVDQAANKRTYFVTYRYFEKKTTVKRDYINILFDVKGELTRTELIMRL